MDPSSTVLSFTEGRALLLFWIALTTGLFGFCVAFLVRPGRPRGGRVVWIGGAAMVWVLALAYLLVERRLTIDPEARRVGEAHQVLGIGPQRTWAFEKIAAVVLIRAPDETLHLSLAAGGEQIAVRAYDDVLQAEAETLALARIGDWQALRRGYRLEITGSGGDVDRFETASGRKGLGINLGAVVRVVPAPGDESLIEP